MSSRQKARKYLRMKQELAELERDLKKEGKEIFLAEGCRAIPRFEKIVERLAA